MTDDYARTYLELLKFSPRVDVEAKKSLALAIVKALESVKDDDPIVFIRRQWNDYRIAKVHLSDLKNPHWTTLSGGVGAPAPRPFLHAYVWCNKIEGEIAHSGVHGEGPHNIKVCIVKKDNTPAVFELIRGRAEP